MNWSPYELPFIRDKFYTLLAEFLNGLSLPMEDALDSLIGEGMLSAPLTWLDSDVCDMIQETFESVPDWSLQAVLPGYSGFIAFEKAPATFNPPVPMLYSDSEAPDVTCDGFYWNTVDGEVHIMMVTRDKLASKFTAGAPLSGFSSLVVPLENKSLVEGYAEDTHRSFALVGTTWLLMSQPRIVEEDSPTVVTRKPRKHKVVSAPIVRVSVRTLSSRPRPSHSRGAPMRKTEKRWWVRGHWRQQAWGKDRALRKPVFIAPHTAGNEDAPIESRPQVQVWRK